MLKQIRNKFFTGIAVLVPIIITVFLVRFIIVEMNKWLLSPFSNLLAPYIEGQYLLYAVKILIFFLLILITCLIGWGANVLFVRKFFGHGERFFIRIPMLGKIYTTVKQISTAFLGQDKTIFKRVVLIEYPRKGIHSIGFVTNETSGELANLVKEESLSVFLATSPNPTSGIFLIVPKSQTVKLKMTVEEAMKLVVSGGAVVPYYHDDSIGT